MGDCDGGRNRLKASWRFVDHVRSLTNSGVILTFFVLCFPTLLASSRSPRPTHNTLSVMLSPPSLKSLPVTEEPASVFVKITPPYVYLCLSKEHNPFGMKFGG
jgi:hypothetical protein